MEQIKPDDFALHRQPVAVRDDLGEAILVARQLALGGVTSAFKRTAQWYRNARYEMPDGGMCGFRLEDERDGELDLVIGFDSAANRDPQTRLLFKSLFEIFLRKRNVQVRRYEPARCPDGHLLNRATVREFQQKGKTTVFCPDCGQPIPLPTADEKLTLTGWDQVATRVQLTIVEHRAVFEQAIFQVKTYVESQQKPAPSCFITYAWGDKAHERWVEKQLASDLQKAGIDVILDRWDNAQIGSSVGRLFVERIGVSDRVVMVGTPRYRQKYDNKVSATGSVVAAEVDVLHNRLLGTEEQKRTVLPLLLAGDKETSLPLLLHSRVYGDFRQEEHYFANAFDLILSLYGIPVTESAVADLRESLADHTFYG